MKTIVIILLAIIISCTIQLSIQKYKTQDPLTTTIDSLTQANYSLQFQIDSLTAQKYQLAQSFASILLLPQNSHIKDSIISIINTNK